MGAQPISHRWTKRGETQSPSCRPCVKGAHVGKALTTSEVERFGVDGHLTVPRIFSDAEIDRAIADIQRWGDEFRRDLKPEQYSWYLEGDAAAQAAGAAPLRKLDQPVAQREVFAELARHPRLVAIVEQLIGRGVTVAFSQVFMKPPEVGVPKPVHQDNFYFGPSDPDSMVTAWIALDEATEENGCLFYGDGSHRRGVVPHFAPSDQPFNLQIPSDQLNCVMSPAPVRRGGVSLHHGNTFHQSSENRSQRWRRAAAFHYMRNDVHLATPALEYDLDALRQITPSP